MNGQCLDQGSSWASLYRCCSTSSLTAAKSGIVLFFFAECIVDWIVASGRSFYSAVVTWLNFIFSTLNLDPASLARIVLLERLANHSLASVVHSWSSLLQDLALPSLSSLSTSIPCTKLIWKKSVKIMLRTQLLLSECSWLPISKCSSASFIQGRICPQWLISIGDRQMLQCSNFRIRLLVGCEGLESGRLKIQGRCKIGNLQAVQLSGWKRHAFPTGLPGSPEYPGNVALSGSLYPGCLHLLSKPTSKLPAWHIMAGGRSHPKIHSKFHAWAQKSTCGIMYTTWPNNGYSPFSGGRKHKEEEGISQICHTYSEDMHPVYPPLPWLHTPRLRHGRGGYIGAYPPLRCGISIYTCICSITTDASKLSVLVHFLVENL